MRFTVLRSKAVHVRFVTNSKLYAYNTLIGNSKFNVLDASTLFFPDFLSALNIVRIIGGKIV